MCGTGLISYFLINNPHQPTVADGAFLPRVSRGSCLENSLSEQVLKDHPMLGVPGCVQLTAKQNLQFSCLVCFARKSALSVAAGFRVGIDPSASGKQFFTLES